MLRSGTDEAGYGPILGPLAVVTVAVEAPDGGALGTALAARGVTDSKDLHDRRSLAPLESVALPALGWLAGRMPANAAEAFALLGEGDAERAALPWAHAAADLPLPLAARISPWAGMPGEPRLLSGALLHPGSLNASRAAGINRADAEWQVVAAGLAEAHRCAAGGLATLACDRLGGRQRYGDRLAAALGGPVEVVAETATAARYRCGASEVAFLVGGELLEPLIALASCIAKYLRELHVLLLNGWWGSMVPGLAPTAGYPQDAARWLAAVGGRADPYRHHLIRTGTT